MRFSTQLSGSVILTNQLQFLHALLISEFFKVSFCLPGVEIQEDSLLTLGLSLYQYMTQAAKWFLLLLFAPMGWEWSLSSVNSWLLAEGLDFCWHKQSTFCETVLRFYPHNGGRDKQARFQIRGFCVLRVEKPTIGHSPPFFSFIDKKHMQYSGLQLARNSAAILRSVQRGANTRQPLMISLNVHQSSSCFALCCTPSSPSIRLPFTQNWNKKGETTPK